MSKSRNKSRRSNRSKRSATPRSTKSAKKIKPRTARETVYVVLEESKLTVAFVSTLLDRWFKQAELSAEDRRLATELALGIVRRRSTLDVLIQSCVNRPRHEIESSLWTLLQLGAYQLVFTNSIPPHAAVHETVELAERLGEPRWKGFLNGVLRSLEGHVTDRVTDDPASDAVPIGRGEYRCFNRPLFPDPEVDPAGYFSAAFSFPKWLAVRWAERFAPKELWSLGSRLNRPPRPSLRVNRLKTSREEMLTALEQAGIAAVAGDLPESVRLREAARIADLPGYAEGWFVVQDETAQRAAPLLDPQPGQTLLDLCAAPGTKTSHLAELMQGEGTLIAADVSPERLTRVEQNRDRLGHEIIQPCCIDEEGSDIPMGPFDAILVDAPCSNTGVLGKRPEARWRLVDEDFGELSELQERLIQQAVSRLKPGGRLVYSTCSIEPEENSDVVQRFLKYEPRLELMTEAEYLPGEFTDGGYQALLRRSR
jgi:16S rRNA (cytosine967-C5)-methyltransferase